MTKTETLKGQSYTTETVHYAQRDKRTGQLVNSCGMSRRQLCYLFPTEAEVTCKKCQAAR